MGFFKFFFEDLRSDLKCLKKLCSSKEYRKESGNKIGSIGLYAKENFGDIIKSYWIWYLIIIFAFLCGFVLAAAYYQSKCSAMIERVVENLTTLRYLAI